MTRNSISFSDEYLKSTGYPESYSSLFMNKEFIELPTAKSMASSQHSSNSEGTKNQEIDILSFHKDTIKPKAFFKKKNEISKTIYIIEAQGSLEQPKKSN